MCGAASRPSNDYACDINLAAGSLLELTQRELARVALVPVAPISEVAAEPDPRIDQMDRPGNDVANARLVKLRWSPGVRAAPLGSQRGG